MENDGNLLPPLLGMYVRSVMTSSEKVEIFSSKLSETT
ncbi:BnaC05g00610D [Brassica napus]|uniref:BnaC05g00610D protein n=1 Tax=Brassica napus TaxID=3708 RepID=A0A078FQP9_BRANA|nr:BnaC05g00610D [Brassica napus]